MLIGVFRARLSVAFAVDSQSACLPSIHSQHTTTDLFHHGSLLTWLADFTDSGTICLYVYTSILNHRGRQSIRSEARPGKSLGWWGRQQLCFFRKWNEFGLLLPNMLRLAITNAKIWNFELKCSEMHILSARQTHSREEGRFAARGERSRELLRGYGIAHGKESREETGKDGASGGKLKVWEGVLSNARRRSTALLTISSLELCIDVLYFDSHWADNGPVSHVSITCRSTLI